ncbi:MAG TPA: hypothetical protein DDZ22_17390 [Massilia sp.]|nr:hypothetical protein [Massilia sp.]
MTAMDEEKFWALMRRAKLLTSDYGSGYITGLRRLFHGERFGNPDELAILAARKDERARGYHDGLAGRDPAPLRHRPPLPPDAPRSDRHPRSVRLSDEHWAKLRRLGTDWLERAIDGADETEPGNAR